MCLAKTWEQAPVLIQLDLFEAFNTATHEIPMA